MRRPIFSCRDFVLILAASAACGAVFAADRGDFLAIGGSSLKIIRPGRP